MTWIVTEHWLRKYARPPAGWSAQQIRALGLRYPLRKGWIDKIVGKKVSDAAKARFEALHEDRVGMAEEEEPLSDLDREYRAIVGFPGVW